MYSTVEVRTSGKSIPNSLGKLVTVVGRVSQVGGNNLKLVTHDDVTMTVKFSSSTTAMPAQDNIVEIKGTVSPDQSIQAKEFLVFDGEFDLQMFDEAMKQFEKLSVFKFRDETKTHP